MLTIPFWHIVILAEGFDIRSGFVDVVVPNVFFGADYRIVCKSKSASCRTNEEHTHVYARHSVGP